MRARWLLPVAVIVAILIPLLIDRDGRKPPAPPPSPPAGGDIDVFTETGDGPLPGEALLATYGDPFSEPIEDLRALDRVISGYFSIVKNHAGYSIGGNGDLAAALRGENAYRQRFVPADHRVFGPDGRILDRWGTPVFVHPLAARNLELRSAGPDRELFTDDDVVLGKPADQ